MNERIEDNGVGEIDLRKMISRDLVQSETGAVLRGPIQRISIKEEVDYEGKPYKIASVYLEWVAIETADGWRLFAKPEDQAMGHEIGAFNMSYSQFSRSADGTYYASIPYIGSMQILNVGDNLAKESVIGFDST